MNTALDTGILELILFGSPRVLRAGQVVTGFVSRKAQALFYYLAVTGQVHQRAQLASMFWPEVEDARALKNLRDVLPNLQHLLGPCLRVTRQTLAFDTSQPYWLDVAEINRLAQRQNESLPLEAQIELTDLYRGEFLEGFYVDDAPEFESWLTFERERLRELVVGTLSAAADTCMQQRTVAAGLAMTGRLLTLEPWREQAHRQRMALLVMADRREAALAQYQQCCMILRQEFDTAPSPHTVEMAKRIRAGNLDHLTRLTSAGESAAPRTETVVPHNLPRALTPFFGRDDELADLVERLTSPDYPLVTLLGLGGVGKTRLALAAAAQLHRYFPDGVWFVPLAGIVAAPETPPEILKLRVAATIVAALSTITAGSDPLTVLLAHLKNRSTLLILDNYEHLIPTAGLIVQLLESAAHLRILVTSRQRLHLMCEQVYQVKGLPVPGLPGSMTEVDVRRLLGNHSSLQLFVERSQRTNHWFRLTVDNLAPVVQICQLLDGLPLGIELAATLAATQGCTTVLEALRDNLDTLASDMPDLPARHQNMQALIDHSWALLDKEDRRALAQISVFYRSIRADAAAGVLDVSSGELRHLVEASLLTELDPGYYGVHDVVRHYAAARLSDNPELEHTTRQRHSAWFLDFVLVREPQLGNDLAAAREVEPELDNIRAAWKWAVAQGDIPTLDRTALAYAAVFKALGLNVDGAAAFRAAATHLQELMAQHAEPPPDLLHTLGKLLLELSFFDERQGHLAEAAASVQQALALGERLADDYLLAGAYARMGAIDWLHGDADSMVRHTTRGIEVAQRAGFGQFEAISFTGLGLAQQYLGNVDAAITAFQRALALANADHRLRLAAIVMLNLAGAYRQMIDFPRAEAMYHEVLRLRQTIGDHAGEGTTRFYLGVTTHIVGNLAAARLHLDRAYHIMHEVADLQYECQVLSNLALLWHHLGDHETALAYGLQGVRMAQEIGLEMALSHAFMTLGHIRHALGQLAEARQAFAVARDAKQEMSRYIERVAAPAGQARVFLTQGDLSAALAQVEQVLPELDMTRVVWFKHPMMAVLTCYEVLHAHGDPRAPLLLQQAHTCLQQTAGTLPDQAARTMFLHNLPAHRQILRYVAQHQHKAAPATGAVS